MDSSAFESEQESSGKLKFKLSKTKHAGYTLSLRLICVFIIYKIISSRTVIMGTYN